MLKYILALSVVSTALLAGCGGRSGNGGIPKAPVVQDESEADFKGVPILAATDPQAQLVSPTNEGCKDNGGAGHKVINSLITPKSQFGKTVTVGLGGEPAPRKYSITSTILTSEPTSYSRTDNYNIPGTSRIDQVTCSFQNVTGSWLNCLDQNFNKKMAKAQDRNKNHCNFEGSNAPNDTKITFQAKTLTISGKQINATRQVIERKGTLTCNKIKVGPGKEVEVHIYSYDIPSLVQDSCSPGEIYSHFTRMDNAGNIYQNSSEKLESYLLPADFPADAPSISDVPLRSVSPVAQEVVPPPPAISSDVSARSVTPAFTTAVVPPAPAFSEIQSDRNKAPSLANSEALAPEPVEPLWTLPDWLSGN